MPNAEFFNRLGLLVTPNFLDAATSAAIFAESKQAVGTPAKVYEGTQEKILDEELRKAKVVEASAETIKRLHEALMVFRPTLEAHFKIELQGCETPQIVRYSEGDYFRLHQDTTDDENTALHVRIRKLAAVLFLNRQAPTPGDPDTFGGGALTFYGLIQDKGWEEMGFAVDISPGTLVIFPATVWHEVTPVTFGERYTMVSMYF